MCGPVSSRGWDNRAGKQSGLRSPKFPDFQHKTDRRALWLSGRGTPAWVVDQLPPPSQKS